MKRTVRVIAICTALAIAALVAFVALTPAGALFGALAYSTAFAEPAPPLLAGATAAGGWRGACPPRNAKEAAMRSAEALSPELNQRLAEQFPPGSSAASLRSTLIAQRFKMVGPCANDPTIQQARFLELTRGNIFQTDADVYWKVDGDRIVWTKGFVFFIGF